jgi:hypothetical protein
VTNITPALQPTSKTASVNTETRHYFTKKHSLTSIKLPREKNRLKVSPEQKRETL